MTSKNFLLLAFAEVYVGTDLSTTSKGRVVEEVFDVGFSLVDAVDCDEARTMLRLT